jgi:hypothetical protein
MAVLPKRYLLFTIAHGNLDSLLHWSIVLVDKQRFSSILSICEMLIDNSDRQIECRHEDGHNRESLDAVGFVRLDLKVETGFLTIFVFFSSNRMFSRNSGIISHKG